MPDALRSFIDAAIVCGDMALPFHYPKGDQWEGWQSGFRIHGLTGEDLVSTAPGRWQPGWFVIALNGFDDPFFVDLGEEAQGFPVYYAPLGAGRWDAQRVAPSVQHFAGILIALRDLATDDAAALRHIDVEVDLGTALWREVRQARCDRSSDAT